MESQVWVKVVDVRVEFGMLKISCSMKVRLHKGYGVLLVVLLKQPVATTGLLMGLPSAAHLD